MTPRLKELYNKEIQTELKTKLEEQKKELIKCKGGVTIIWF